MQMKMPPSWTNWRTATRSAAENSRLELGRAVTAISESGNNLRQIGKKEKIDARIRGKFLLQT
jgi:hypothetical protein